MKLLVTGCNGFVGSYVVKELLAQGHQVVGLGSKPGCSIPGIPYYAADISDPDAMAAAAEKIGSLDGIIHCAACIHFSDTDNNLMLVNAMGTQNVVLLAKKCGAKKIVYCSSCPIIGVPVEHPVTEDHPLAPATVYHISKLAGEYILQASGLDHVLLRIPSPIGVGMNPKTILPVMLGRAMQNEPITLFGKGTRVQNYISARDIARAAALTMGPGPSGCYLLAGDAISNKDLARLCCETAGSSSEIQFVPRPDPADSQVWDLSGEKIKQDYGFVPEDTIVSILRELFLSASY